MDLDITDEDDRLLVSSDGDDHTVMTLLKQAVWDVGGRAGYDTGNPYAGDATLVVNADDPADTLQDAIDHARDQLDAFRDAFSSA